MRQLIYRTTKPNPNHNPNPDKLTWESASKMQEDAPEAVSRFEEEQARKAQRRASKPKAKPKKKSSSK